MTRVVAAAIEQNNDSNGILWPDSIAPFQLAICPINYHKAEEVRQATDRLYEDCQSKGIEVLLDDRVLRPGAMFSDMELIGVPHRIVLSQRGLNAEQFEYKGRRDDKASEFPLSELSVFVDKIFA